MSLLNLDTVRCEALFASPLVQSDDVTPAEVRQAVMRTVRALGSRGCAAWVAQEYGDYPEVAAGRMRWARRLVAETYGDPRHEREQVLRPPPAGGRRILHVAGDGRLKTRRRTGCGS